MKPNRSYNSKVKLRHRIIAIVICASLVIAAVAVGVSITVSLGYAEPTDGTVTDTTDPDTGDGTGTDAGTGDADSGADSGDVDTEEPVASEKPVSINIIKFPDVMSVGAKAAISYELKNADAGQTVKWKSNKDEVATVDADGMVSALSAGKVKITASAGNAKDTVTITVTKKVIEPKSFKLEVDEFTVEDMVLTKHSLQKGDKVHMTAKAEPAGAKLEGKFEWNIERTDVGEQQAGDEQQGDPATIEISGDNNENAVLTAENAGEITLTVKYIDDENKDERVELADNALVFSVAKEKSWFINDLLIVVFIVIVAILIIIFIAIAVNRKRRIEYDKRRARDARRGRDSERAGDAREKRDGGHGRDARKKRDSGRTRDARRKRNSGGRDQAKRRKPRETRRDDYEQRYTDYEDEQSARTTRSYDVPPAQDAYQGQQQPPERNIKPRRPPLKSGSAKDPDRPFSIDDID